MLKKTILFFVASFITPIGLVQATVNQNNGFIDGIYQCSVDLEGQTSTSFMSINGRYDGRTVFLVAAETEVSNGFSGFGLGRVSGDRFSGNTSHGKRFSLTLELIDLDDEGYYSGVHLKGPVGVIGSAGQAVNAVVDCKTIW
jgi:hypothetical protein